VIFKQEHVDMILAGTKTQTRRLNRGYYKVGHTYAIQPCRTCIGVPGYRIFMDLIWEEWVECGTNAAAEGGYTIEEFERLFRELYPKWDGKKRWAYEFHVVKV